MASPNDYPTLLVNDKEAWRDWLDQHHDDQPGVWLRLAKVGSALESVSYSEALEVALCYGWIDGQAKKFDEDSWIQKFTPRRKRSLWSKRNRDLVERLIAVGLMHDAGLAAVDAAKSDGRWERAYSAPSKATVPDDLRIALNKSPEAKAFFETINNTNRFAILNRIETAVKPETRARRIAKFVAMLERGETLY